MPTALISRISRILLLLGCAVATGVSFASAQMVNENIIADMPKGYKVAIQRRQSGITHVEMIPSDQTLETWKDKFVVRIFHNSLQSLAGLESRMAKRWFEACPRAAYRPDKQGTENGYGFSFFFLVCPELSGSGKPMSRIVKLLRGQDSLYLAQAIVKRALTPQVVDEWVPFMTKINLCDTRIEEKACPPGL